MDGQPIPAHPVLAAQAVEIHSEPRVAEARRLTRLLAERAGCGRNTGYYLVTCATELCTNLLVHAGGGWFQVRLLRRADGVTGVELGTEDRGPGIPDPALALTDGYSTAGGLGGGLPGVRRLTDELYLAPRPGGGTRVVARKWTAGSA